MTSKILMTLTAVAISFNTAATSVWKVEKNDQHIYMGGTVHVLSESDYPLPDIFNETFALSDEVIFETDIAKAQSPEFQLKAIREMTYTNGESIAKDLSDDTLKMLKAYLAERNLPYEQFSSFKASLLGVTIAAIELQIAGIGTAGVDQYFYSSAKSNGKKVAFLESLDAQIEAIASMGRGQEDEFIHYSLQWAEQTGSWVKDLTTNWREGNIEYLDTNYVSLLKQDYPDVYESVLVKRNNNWMPIIEAMFNDDDIEFVLVGVLHLAGEHSVLTQLSERGYQVTQLQ